MFKNLDERIFDLLIKLKLDGFIQFLVFTWRVKWLRNLVARLLKTYRIKQEFNMLERSLRLNSETQSAGTLKASIGDKKFHFDSEYDSEGRLQYLQAKHNHYYKFWFMEEI